MKKIKIYIVDDEPDLLDAYEMTLKGVYHITPFLSPLALIDTLKQGSIPDVIVTDIKMPEMDGLQLLAWLRKNKIEKPVVVVSGHADQGHALELFKLGPTEFIEKPFQSEFFRNSVRRMVLLSLYQKFQQECLVKFREFSDSLTHLAQNVNQTAHADGSMNTASAAVSAVPKNTTDLEKIVQTAQAYLSEMMQLEQQIKSLL